MTLFLTLIFVVLIFKVCLSAAFPKMILFLSQDFMSPHLKMFSDRDFGELGMNIDLSVPVINMDETGYGMKTQSIDVGGGV